MIYHRGSGGAMAVRVLDKSGLITGHRRVDSGDWTTGSPPHLETRIARWRAVAIREDEGGTCPQAPCVFGEACPRCCSDQDGPDRVGSLVQPEGHGHSKHDRVTLAVPSLLPREESHGRRQHQPGDLPARGLTSQTHRHVKEISMRRRGSWDETPPGASIALGI